MSSPTFSSAILLCVLIKSGKIQTSNNECYSYVVIKIDNVKSTTNIVKGQQPNWEQEFYFDVGNYSGEIQIELWERGQYWDKLLGLANIQFDQKNNKEFRNKKVNRNNVNERWINLYSDSILNNQEDLSKKCSSTEHSLLICTYIEFPSDLTEQESNQLKEQLQILHQFLNKKEKQLAHVTTDEINSISNADFSQQSSDDNQQLNPKSHSHFSDDSDYTSDKSNSINGQSNLNDSSSVLQLNLFKFSNETNQILKSNKKPFAFIKPIRKDFNSNQNTKLLFQESSILSLHQPKSLSMNKFTNFNHYEK